MPIVTFRECGGVLYAYTTEQDLEARVLQVEHGETGRWGDAIALEGGRRYYVNPQLGRSVFLISLHATRSTLP